MPQLNRQNVKISSWILFQADLSFISKIPSSTKCKGISFFHEPKEDEENKLTKVQTLTENDIVKGRKAKMSWME